jgi:hypothetical protein
LPPRRGERARKSRHAAGLVSSGRVPYCCTAPLSFWFCWSGGTCTRCGAVQQ